MSQMVFPSTLTEEEEMLKARYVALRKKKKALQDLKVKLAKASTAEADAAKSIRPADARSAREAAQKLIKAGKISPIKTPNRTEENFKRSRALERKLNSTTDNKATIRFYEPFPENHDTQQEHTSTSTETKKPESKTLYSNFVRSGDYLLDSSVETASLHSTSSVGNTDISNKTTTNVEINAETCKISPSKAGTYTSNSSKDAQTNSSIKNVNSSTICESKDNRSGISNENPGPCTSSVGSTVLSNNSGTTTLPSSSSTGTISKKLSESPTSKPRTKGPTVFVFGVKLSRDFLRKHFTQFGNITKIVMEKERVGFVTFDTTESAEKAINQMDGTKVDEIELQVSMARKQSVMDKPPEDNTSVWCTSPSKYYKQRKKHKETRVLKPYEENLFE